MNRQRRRSLQREKQVGFGEASMGAQPPFHGYAKVQALRHTTADSLNIIPSACGNLISQPSLLLQRRIPFVRLLLVVHA